MEPLNREGNADRPRSAGAKQSGRVIVIGPYLRMRRGDPEAQTDQRAIRNSEARLEEAAGLAEAIGIVVAAGRAVRVRTVRPATLLGKGQVEEVDVINNPEDPSAGVRQVPFSRELCTCSLRFARAA